MRPIDADLLLAVVETGRHNIPIPDGNGVLRKYLDWDGVKHLIERAPTIDAVPVVRCKDCKNRGTPYSCPMRKLVMPWQGAGSYEDCTEDEGYCHMGKRKDGGVEDENGR